MPSMGGRPSPPNGGPRIGLYPDAQPPNEYGEIEVPEEVQMEDGDSCCDDAKEKLAQSWSDKNNFSPSQYQQLRSQLDSMDCGEFRMMLETIPGTGPGTDMANHESNINRDQNILDEWDECASRTSMGMKYASADPFEAAWDIMQKQIGREDFTYRMAVQPHLMSNKFGNMPPELGLRTTGKLPIKEAIRHLENSQSIEDFARTKGWESAEDVGLKLEDFDDEDQFYEAQAEMGVGYDPLDHLAGEYQYFRPYHAKDIARRPDGGITDAEILRVNMEGMGHPNEYREAFPAVARDTMLEGLDSRLEAGATKAPVSTGSISAMGQGPMIDVNPAFAGMGLGYSTLASLLENTGRLQENYMSAGGLATLQGLGRKLDEAGIGHNMSISPMAQRPVMNAQQQLNNWQESNARYPHQGTAEMSIDDGTQLTHQGTPDKLGYITHSINQQLDNERPSTIQELKAMLEASKRRRGIMGGMPPSMNRFPPFSAPSWQERISWGE